MTSSTIRPRGLLATTDGPVLSLEAARALGARVIQMVTADSVSIEITHTARQITRITNNRVLIGDVGNELELSIRLGFGQKGSAILSNQVDDAMLRSLVRRAESVAQAMVASPFVSTQRVPLGAQQYIPVTLWRDGTLAAFAERPATVADIIETVRSAGLVASGFVGLMARSHYLLGREDGTEAYCRETDCECTVGARTPDGSASGWDGQAHRDWTKIDPRVVAARAVDMAKRSVNPVAVEPGRRTVILGPLAVAQLLHGWGGAFDAEGSDTNSTPFSKPVAVVPNPKGITDVTPVLLNKLGLRVFDPRLTVSSAPDDPDGGYSPFFGDRGYPQPRMTWVENGVLMNLAYDPGYALRHGKPWSGPPESFRVSGGPTTIDEMISSCDEGIYVNRISNTEGLDPRTGLETGVTRDGCFLVKHGKIERPVRNFRLVDSPWFFLNNVIALGATGRQALGYTPGNDDVGWPRPPVIVPPMMVRDFNFTALSNAI